MTELNAVCVFCGSRNGTKGVYRDAAERLGQILAGEKINLIYGGGGKGLMGTIAKATHEAGGHVTGIVPEDIIKFEGEYDGIDSKIVTGNMHERKWLMHKKSDAFVTLPGGVGTVEEMSEVLSWAYLNFHTKPMVVVNIDGYWTPFLEMMRHLIDTGFASEHVYRSGGDDDLLLVVDKVDEVVPRLRTLLAGRTADGPDHVRELA